MRFKLAYQPIHNLPRPIRSLRFTSHNHGRRNQRAHNARNPFPRRRLHMVLPDSGVRLPHDTVKATRADLLVHALRGEGPEIELEHGFDDGAAETGYCSGLGDGVGAEGCVVDFFPLDPAVWFWVTLVRASGISTNGRETYLAELGHWLARWRNRLSSDLL